MARLHFTIESFSLEKHVSFRETSIGITDRDVSILRNKLTVKTPGKLMVAGEYAVLEANQPLIVMAVNRYIFCTIEMQQKGTLHLNDLNFDEVAWEFQDGEVLLNDDHPHLNFVKNALQFTLQFLREKGYSFSPFSLSVRSELNDGSGLKYGLGSSAAVVTAVVSAVLHMFDDNTTKDIIFKVAAMAHTMTQRSGSGADIAASTYGGVMTYTSFQAEWLLEKLTEQTSVKSIVEGNWPYLSRKSLQFPEHVQVFVGWTGIPASTTNLVKEVKRLKTTNQDCYDQFLNRSREAVEMIAKGMEENDPSVFFLGIKTNRLALAELGDSANVIIETDRLYQLSIAAEKFAGAGKLSGAGGGDCGIVFVPKNVAEKSIYSEWEKDQIVPLSLSICFQGVELLNV